MSDNLSSDLILPCPRMWTLPWVMPETQEDEETTDTENQNQEEDEDDGD